jgi:oligoendopeptidase F
MNKSQPELRRLTPFYHVEAGATGAVKQRGEIEEKHKWRLADIFPGEREWQDKFAELETMVDKLRSYQGKLAESGENLFACLDWRDQMSILFQRLQLYAFLKLDEDNRESKYQAMTDQVSAFGTKLAEAASFITPEIMTISDERLNEMKQESERLRLYDHHLDDLRRLRDHILPPEQERLLALAGNVTRNAAQIFRMLDDADIEFGEVSNEEGQKITLTKQRYHDLLESYDRGVRKEAMEALNNAYVDLQNTLGATLTASMYNDLFYKQARNYNSCLEASLSTSNIPVETYHNLTRTVAANLDSLHRYTALRKKLLGYEELHPYDIYVPLIPEAKFKVSYDQARERILAALAPFGPDYVKQLNVAFDSGWIDVYETQGKGSGAYSWGTYAVHPFVLLNYNDTLDNMFTVAHELGHALHSHYSRVNQPFVYAGHAIFTAEVASTTNEALLLDYMLRNSDDPKLKAYLANYRIQQVVGTFFTQTLFSEFEARVHADVEEGKPLSAANLRSTFGEIYQRFWGPELKLLESTDVSCLRIPHFYRSFYVYQYATSFAASSLIAELILSGDSEARDRYLDFLKAGESKYPIDLLKDAGVDLTSSEPIEATIRLFDKLVEELDVLLSQPQNDNSRN